MSRGQVAVEYVFMVSFLLLFVGAFSGYAVLVYSDSLKNSSLNNSVIALQDASKKVYSLGRGNTVIVEINLPDDVVSSGINGKDFYFARQVFGGLSYNYGTADSNLTGILPSSPGTYRIAVRSADLNVSFSTLD